MTVETLERPRTTETRFYPENDFVALATPMFELVMKIRAEFIQPSMDLQKTIDDHLNRLERRARALKYPEKQIELAKFALAAYIDEMVLMARFPFRDEWEKYPVQLKHFGEHLAGVTFYERLKEILRDAERQGDVLELYYMCLLLGFKGQFRDYFEEELASLTQEVESTLRSINRLRNVQLSPHWLVTDQPALQIEPLFPLWFRIFCGSAGAVLVLLFLVLKLGLAVHLNSAREMLLH
ncbi:MAG: type IVB secretion system protein IcmH/DotU [Blastocatellia bacterium]|nr:type IVB secretion system protein IcmH/DotU [Blastocatellia bacterium]